MLTISQKEIARKSQKLFTTYILAVIVVWLILLNVLIIRPEKKSELKVIEANDPRTVRVIDWTDERTVKVKEDKVKMTGNKIIDAIYRTFPEDPYTALAIAKAESNLNPLATGYNSNGSIDVGIFMINDVHGFSVEERMNIEKNLEIARKLYEKRHWKPWVVYNTGRYLKFMD
jgi:hypothetical protein